MSEVLARVRTLTDTQRDHLREAWPHELPPPGRCTTTEQIGLAHQTIDALIGYDEPVDRGTLISSAGRALRSAGLLSDDHDWSAAAIVNTTGRDVPPDQLTDDELHAVWLTCTKIVRGDLVLRFDDQDRPWLISREAHQAGHKLEALAIANAKALAATPHPDDTRIGLWRHVAVIIDPTGEITVRASAGDRAATHARNTETNPAT